MKKLALSFLMGFIVFGALSASPQTNSINMQTSSSNQVANNQESDHSYFTALSNLFSKSTPKETIEGVTALIEKSTQSPKDSTIDKGVNFVTQKLNRIIINYVTATVDFKDVPLETRKKFVEIASKSGFLSDDESELIIKGDNLKEKQKPITYDAKESDGIVSRYFSTVKSLATASSGVDTLQEATKLLEESNKLKDDSVVDQGIKTAVNQFNKITIHYINTHTDFQSIPKEVREKYVKESLKAGLLNDEEAKHILEGKALNNTPATRP
jgi:hypothetical protein